MPLFMQLRSDVPSSSVPLGRAAEAGGEVEQRGARSENRNHKQAGCCGAGQEERTWMEDLSAWGFSTCHPHGDKVSLSCCCNFSFCTF